MENLIYLTVFFLPTYLIRFQIFGVPTNVLEILILLTAFICFSQSANRQLMQKYVPKYVLGYVLPILLLLAGLVLSIATNENWRTGLGILKGWFILPLLFALIVMIAAKDDSVKEKILKTLYFSTFCVSLIALVYFFADKVTYDGRLAAFYLSPNYLAMYLAFGLVFGIWYLVFSIDKKKTKYLYIPSLITIATAFYLTYSYAAWMAVIGSFLLIRLLENLYSCHPALDAGSRINNTNTELDSCFHRNDTTTKSDLIKIIFITGIIISLIIISQWSSPKLQSLLTLNERSSWESRLMIWQSAAKILKDHWLFGIGPGNFQAQYLEYQKYFPPYLEWAVPQPHNLYLAFWLQSGPIGLFGFLWLVALWIKNTIKKLGHPLPKLLLALMFYTLLHGLIDTTYWKNDLALIFWLIIVLGIITDDTIEVKKS